MFEILIAVLTVIFKIWLLCIITVYFILILVTITIIIRYYIKKWGTYIGKKFFK